MTSRIPSLVSRRRERAAALVIVLAFVVLLTGVVVAYFSRAVSNRKLSNSSFNQAKTDEMARSALDIIVSGLRQEIVNGSTANTSGTTTVYLPNSAAAMFPVRNGIPQSSGTAIFPTLLRVSSTNAISTPAADFTASDTLTTGTSSNGRYITPARWNKHYLIPRNPSLYSGATNSKKLGTDPDPRFPAPAWIFLTGTGPAAPALTAPSRAVIGRYAYAIYDEGALLDANVAGGPYTSGALPSEYSLKGSIAFADLTALGISATSGINNIVGWRNRATLAPSGNLSSNFTFGSSAPSAYRDFILSNTTGFLTVSGTGATATGGTTDQLFLSRQELIAFSRATSGSIIPQDALQYLGTFSRAINAPSWMPSTPADSNILYADIANDPTSSNRNLSNVRFSASGAVTHYRDDGMKETYEVKAGDLLLRRRFSLAKLAWLTHNGPKTQSSGAAGAVQSCFGLIWEDDHWRYSEHSGTADPIKTLATVASENREPNFFELLKAGILAGSVGKQPGAIGYAGELRNAGSDQGPSGKDFETYFGATSDQHILQIGLNIIDQFDADSYPTAFYCAIFNDDGTPEHQPVNMLYGVENLPYLFAIEDFVAQTGTSVYQGWLQPTLWNPHQVPTTIANSRPTRFRIVASGQAYIRYSTNGGADNYPSPVVDFNNSPDEARIYFSDLGGTGSAFYSNPNALTVPLTAMPPTSGTAYNVVLTGTSNENIAESDQTTMPPNYWNAANYGGTYTYPDGQTATVSSTANQPVGFHAGKVDPFTPKTWNNGGSCKEYIYPAPMLTFCLQYWDGAAYRPYAYMSRIASWTYFDIPTQGASYKVAYARPDPRTDRFSAGFHSSGYGSTKTRNATYQKDKSTSDSVWRGIPRKSLGFTYTSNKLAEWARNMTSGTASYTDNDGVTRAGDAYLENTASGHGCLQFHATSGTAASITARRPVILDRPFRSVAELGYVFRDLPFKSLDFWSSTSADGALLDLFCINENEPSVSAGQLNPNNAPSPILQAVIAGTLKNENSGIATTTTTAARLADALAARLSQTPIKNRADLPSALGSALAVVTGTALDPDLANKAYGEAAARALAPTTQTRTWNLLIDVIAQSGIFSPSASTSTPTLNSSFVVQGERRYWLHLAIDRFTGKVIDQQLEPVYE